jgi:hypothetical protein
MEISENPTSRLQAKPGVATDRDFERLLARTAANACLKMVFMARTKRPLGSFMGQLQKLDRRISQVVNHG